MSALSTATVGSHHLALLCFPIFLPKSHSHGQALQSIGNLGLQPGKEPWMAPLNTVLLPSITRVRAFLDSLIEVDSTQGEQARWAPRNPTPSWGYVLYPKGWEHLCAFWGDGGTPN